MNVSNYNLLIQKQKTPAMADVFYRLKEYQA
jgi:hypothetical protein